MSLQWITTTVSTEVHIDWCSLYWLTALEPLDLMELCRYGCPTHLDYDVRYAEKSGCFWSHVINKQMLWVDSLLIRNMDESMKKFMGVDLGEFNWIWSYFGTFLGFHNSKEFNGPGWTRTHSPNTPMIRKRNVSKVLHESEELECPQRAHRTQGVGQSLDLNWALTWS